MTLAEIIFDTANKGILITTYCFNCKTHIWPPNHYCNSCFQKTGFKKINRKGVLVEKSFSNIPDLIGYYGVGEFSSIRVMGSIDENILPNDRIRISKVSTKDNKLSLEFTKIKIKKLK